MDQWKAAFKQIYGKTPTKMDFSVAPLSIRTELTKSPEHFKKSRRKRNRLALKADGEFGSPLKLRKSSDEHTKSGLHKGFDDGQQCSAMCRRRSVPSPSDFDRLMLAPSPSLRQISFLSPIKNWCGFLPPKQNEDKMCCVDLTIGLSALLKTPSPARVGKRSIVCANVGQLLTPEKSVNSMPEKGEESGQLEEEKAAVADGVKTNEAVLREVTGKKKRTRMKQKVVGNFVTVNLRRRRFAPISKSQGRKWKKNWKKLIKKR